MAKPDRELEELDQRFAEVERTIQSACETMEKLKEASPKIEKIHRMSSEIHEIKDKALQEIQPLKVRLQDLADRYVEVAKKLDGLKQELRELQEAKDLIWIELSKCVSSSRLTQLEEEVKERAVSLGIRIAEQNNKFSNALAQLSGTLENQNIRMNSITQDVANNAKTIKLALLVGIAALFLAGAALFLSL